MAIFPDIGDHDEQRICRDMEALPGVTADPGILPKGRPARSHMCADRASFGPGARGHACLGSLT